MMTMKSVASATSPFRCRKTLRRSLKQSCNNKENEKRNVASQHRRVAEDLVTTQGRPLPGAAGKAVKKCPVQLARHDCKFESQQVLPRRSPREKPQERKFDPAAFRSLWPQHGWLEMEDEEDVYHVYEDIDLPPTPPPVKSKPLPPLPPQGPQLVAQRSCSDSELIRVSVSNVGQHEVEISTSMDVRHLVTKTQAQLEHGFYRCHDNLEDVNDRDLVPDLAPKLLREKRAHLQGLVASSIDNVNDHDSSSDPNCPRRFSFDSGWGESEIADEDVLLGILNSSMSATSLPSLASSSSASSGIGSIQSSCSTLPKSLSSVTRGTVYPCRKTNSSSKLTTQTNLPDQRPVSGAKRLLKSPPPPPLPPRNAPPSRLPPPKRNSVSTRSKSRDIAESVEALQHLSADLLKLINDQAKKATPRSATLPTLRPRLPSPEITLDFPTYPDDIAVPDSLKSLTLPCRRTLNFSDTSIHPDQPHVKPESNNNSIVCHTSPSLTPEVTVNPSEKRPSGRRSHSGTQRCRSSLFRNPLQRRKSDSSSRSTRQSSKRLNEPSTPLKSSAGRTPARRPTDVTITPPQSLKSTKRRRTLFNLASPFSKPKFDRPETQKLVEPCRADNPSRPDEFLEEEVLPIVLSDDDRREVEEVMLEGLPVIPFVHTPRLETPERRSTIRHGVRSSISCHQSMTVRALATPIASRRLPRGYLLEHNLENPSIELLLNENLLPEICQTRHCKSCTCSSSRTCVDNEDYVRMDGRQDLESLSLQKPN